MCHIACWVTQLFHWPVICILTKVIPCHLNILHDYDVVTFPDFLCLLRFLFPFSCNHIMNKHGILYTTTAMVIWQQICADVWSPMSIEAAAIEHVLPFVRVCALLQFHLFHDVLPSLHALVWLMSGEWIFCSDLLISWFYVHTNHTSCCWLWNFV